MKYAILMILLMSVSLASCKNPEPQGQPPQVTDENTEAVTPDVSAAEVTWLVDYDEAITQAKDRNLPILINFSGSDWCGWCIKLMNEVFSKPEFMSYAKDNFVLLNLDFPRKTQLPPAQAKTNEGLAQKFGIEGFPTVILLDSSGTKIGQTGYQAGGPDKYIRHLQELIAQAK